MSSRESRRDELDRDDGIEGRGASWSKPIWLPQHKMYGWGAGQYLSQDHTHIKRLIKAGKLEPPPE